MFRICAQAREILCDFYIQEGLFVPCPVGMGGLSYQMYTKQHLVTLKDIFVTNLAVLSTKSGKVFKIASLWRILMYFFQVFNDVHMLMCTLGAKNEDATLKLLASLREFVRYIQLPYSFSCLFKNHHDQAAILNAPSWIYSSRCHSCSLFHRFFVWLTVILCV